MSQLVYLKDKCGQFWCQFQAGGWVVGQTIAATQFPPRGSSLPNRAALCKTKDAPLPIILTLICRRLAARCKWCVGCHHRHLFTDRLKSRTFAFPQTTWLLNANANAIKFGVWVTSHCRCQCHFCLPMMAATKCTKCYHLNLTFRKVMRCGTHSILVHKVTKTGKIWWVGRTLGKIGKICWAAVSCAVGVSPLMREKAH